MNRNRVAAALLALFPGLILLSCGGGSSNSRVLESISISPNPAMAKNGTVQLVATGTFSSAPVTVTPLPADWSQSPCDNLCNGTPEVVGPISVNDSGLAGCAQGYAGTLPVKAVAPKNPSLPPDTQNVPTVTGTTNVTCP